MAKKTDNTKELLKKELKGEGIVASLKAENADDHMLLKFEIRDLRRDVTIFEIAGATKMKDINVSLGVSWSPEEVVAGLAEWLEKVVSLKDIFLPPSK